MSQNSIRPPSENDNRNENHYHFQRLVKNENHSHLDLQGGHAPVGGGGGCNIKHIHFTNFSSVNQLRVNIKKAI